MAIDHLGIGFDIFESEEKLSGVVLKNVILQGVSEVRSPVTKEPDASLDSRLDDHHHIFEGPANNNSSGKKVEECEDFFSLRDDADIMTDEKMVQAIKGVLKEDFIGENEIPSETLLYKNLWLVAEATLCTISCRARFNLMKIEMEKCKSNSVKGLYATSKPVIFYYTYSNCLGLKYEVIHAKVKISK